MSYKLSKTAAYAFAGISLAAMSGTAMADVLVTNSSGAAAREYPRGTRLGDSQPIVLRRGDSVTVLTRGGTRRFRGPGRYTASGSRQVASNALSSSSNSRTRARTGVSRTFTDTDPSSLPPNRRVWQVDVSESGPFCYLPGQTVTLWRPATDEQSEITITQVGNQNSQTVAFGEGQASLNWPASLTAAPGAEYRISWPGMMVATRVTFAQLSVDPNDPVAVGMGLLENNCGSQLDALVAHSEDAPAPEGSTG